MGLSGSKITSWIGSLFTSNEKTTRNWNPQSNDSTYQRSVYIPSTSCAISDATHSSVRVGRPLGNGLNRPRPQQWLDRDQLGEYPLPKHILDVERDDNPEESSMEKIRKLIALKADFRASEDRYVEAYQTMAFFEEAAETLKIAVHDYRTVDLHHINDKAFYFNLPPASDQLTAAIDDKQLTAFILKSTSSSETLNGQIKRREVGQVFVELHPARNWCCNKTYDIFFKVQRIQYQLQHNALHFIQKHHLFPILVNNPSYHSQSVHAVPRPLELQSIENSHALNFEQMQAVECILHGKYNPVPYLIYGPPGTGKTKTVVAAIEKIVQTTTKNILVCAQSNAACNEIAERLAFALTDTQMLRMFSMSYDTAKISETIERFCNLFDGQLKYPMLESLYEYRVLICTLSAAGNLVRARFNADHFGYVFIDECASATETMALIPIAGLCTSKGQVHANIVLIGDPKQLDAVTKSDWSTKLGFKTSWFEQLFNSAMYQRHTVTGQFNHHYITQLVQNYRSHRAILKIPNELFYENLLKAAATPDHIELEVEGLIARNFPIIFKSVHGYTRKPNDDTSSFNMEEVNAVMDFIVELLQPDKCQVTQSDIGVVSPYKRQCKVLRQRCAQKDFGAVTIGTAEVFQGQERKVMIISPVQSDRRSLVDFVRNPQRFNVMLTRAKSLLIVVGNPHLLSQDENWSTFIRFCFKNRCLVQDRRRFRPT